MEAEVFLDAAYAIALANAKDQFHKQAVRLAKQLRSANTKLSKTQIVFEIRYQSEEAQNSSSIFENLVFFTWLHREQSCLKLAMHCQDNAFAQPRCSC